MDKEKIGLYPWIVWALAASFYCYGFFHRVAPSVMINELMADFAVNAAILGNLSAFYFYAYAGLQLPVGILFDQWGAKRVLIMAALLSALGSWIFAEAETLTGAYTGRLLIGAGAGFTWVGALKLAADWLPPNRFAMVTGMTLMLGMIGAVGGQAPLASVVAAVGWRGTMFWAALFALGLAVLLWLVVKDKENSKTVQSDEQDVEPKTVGLLDGLKKVLSKQQSWYAAVFGASMTAPMLAFAGLWGVPYLMQAYDLSRPAAALSTSLLLIGWGAGAPLAGWISDRIVSRKIPMMLGAFMAVSTFSILIYYPDLPLFAARVLLFVNGFFSGVMPICFAVSRENNIPRAAGAALSFVNMFVMASGAVFQPVIGWLLDRQWDGSLVDGGRLYSVEAYQTAFLTLVGCGVVAVTMALLLRETRCRNVT